MARQAYLIMLRLTRKELEALRKAGKLMQAGEVGEPRDTRAMASLGEKLFDARADYVKFVPL